MQELLGLVLDQIRNVWRFRWVALAVAWAIAIVGWLFVYSLPNEYRSQARVHIDTKSAIGPLLSGMAVLPNASSQVDLLIQTVLSRPNLSEIARRTGLDLNATGPEEEQALLDGLRQRINLRATGGKTDLYTINYVSRDPQTAQAVVQQVINVMTNMAIGEGRNSTDSTQATAFLSNEVDKYKQRLQDIERQLADFKKDNAEFMPGASDYATRVRNANAEIASLQDQLTMAQQRRASLQAGGTGGPTRVSAENSSQVRSIDSQIAQRQQQVQQLLGKYTDQHPDVISARRDLERLRQERASTLANLRANPSQIETTTGGSGGGVAAQIADASAQISTLSSAIERKKSQLDELKAGADDMTDAQAQLAELSRNYQATQDQYQKLLTRLYSARLSTDVGQANDPLKFRVIDPPERPAEPSGPQRTVLMTMALFGALAAGAAFAFFLSQIRPVYINRRALTDATGLPVLGSVSMAWSVGQRAQRHSGLVLFVICFGTLLVGYVGAVLFAPIGVNLVPNFVSGQFL
ncbi:XrtA system polysaccharide chain length determinant [Salinisphaera sp. T31B1]|uniref:XrtA system polysaccharide chain length determinant n=1 Tax=Salinisphaera sp. T31B1 TaxID=727963 RepID=UPI003342D5DA